MVAASRALGSRPILVHTGQHYDINMSQIFFKELEIPEPEYNLDIGSGSHGEMTGAMIQKIEEVLLKERPDCVLGGVLLISSANTILANNGPF